MAKQPYKVQYGSASDVGWIGGTGYILSISSDAAWRQCLRIRTLARKRHIWAPAFDKGTLQPISWTEYRKAKKAGSHN